MRLSSDSSFGSGPSDEERIEKDLAVAAKSKDQDIFALAKSVLHADTQANLTSILKQQLDESDRTSLNPSKS